jgi:acetylornithine deacetylase/succinyl-diaminopimelate desuccinylase-like protein
LSGAVAARIEDACRAGGWSYYPITSGAIHDAQAFADLCETGMIFLPSRGGISHHPHEYTSPQHIKTGLQVLYQTCRAQLMQGSHSA